MNGKISILFRKHRGLGVVYKVAEKDSMPGELRLYFAFFVFLKKFRIETIAIAMRNNTSPVPKTDQLKYTGMYPEE